MHRRAREARYIGIRHHRRIIQFIRQTAQPRAQDQRDAWRHHRARGDRGAGLLDLVVQVVHMYQLL
jgi:hypothetical protein